MHVAMLAAFLLASPGHVTPFQRGSGATSKGPNLTFQPPKCKALIFASKTYKTLPSLPNTVVDAANIEAVLEDSYGFDVKTFTNPTRAEVLQTIQKFALKMGDTPDPRAQLLVYFSGHGRYVEEPDQAGYITLAGTGDHDEDLEYFHLQRILLNSKYDRILLILDVCEAGKFATLFDNGEPRGAPKLPLTSKTEKEFYSTFSKQSAKQTRYVIAPSDGTIPDGKPGQGSAFANAFITALTETDRGDGAITAWNLFEKIGEADTCMFPFTQGGSSGSFHFISIRKAKEWKGRPMGG